MKVIEQSKFLCFMFHFFPFKKYRCWLVSKKIHNSITITLKSSSSITNEETPDETQDGSAREV
jgi:hypothetical protein